jgi:hypothetical protein
VQRTGGVGRDELEVDVAPAQLAPGAVGPAARQDVPDQGALRVRGKPQVQEAGAGDLGGLDAVRAREGLGEPAGELPRWHPGLLGGAQRDVRGVVPVLGVAGALDADVRRERRLVQASLAQHV